MSNLFPATSFSDSSPQSLDAGNQMLWTPDHSPIPTASAAEVEFSRNDNDVGNNKKKSGRKGHTKSRKGCFNCKRARIKCKENRPSCDYCAHRGLRCEWPDMQVQMNMNQARSTVRDTAALVSYSQSSSSPSSSSYCSPSSLVPLQVHGGSPVLNMRDFRFFHHFIESAYPHHPIGNDSVWKHEIPIIASDVPILSFPRIFYYDYLLHSMLALGASDLADHETDPSKASELKCAAMSHRVQAISSLNAGISAGLTRFEQGNAMLATCFALLFQSVLLSDGLAEYMTFIRGTVAVGIQMGMKGMHVLFDRLFHGREMEIVDPLITKAPLITPHLARAAIRSLEKVGPLCKSVVEVKLYGMLLTTARALVTSSRDAYLELGKIYGAFSYYMPHSEFAELINPSNLVCQVLQAHFVALQLTMTPITSQEWAGRESSKGGGGDTLRWFTVLHRNVPDEMMKYYEWTMWVESEVSAGRIFNGVVAIDESMEELHIIGE
ncbi:uncharacterized protein BP5553_05435 [Venustampulla echinocandica]|uniref:Zn(2)-C6 fungal-type domain-containing protein n=1 Tax=Venustampulla echinocandica TaxID=2656787 RepID=A0A370TR52_9HELO|nr:uncharacterized protein BP5553_05435 [Venustampulla echinocandica]RDL38002.1 hypothetical protein BP5553_05435 [Venustampulla echinocandica]